MNLSGSAIVSVKEPKPKTEAAPDPGSASHSLCWPSGPREECEWQKRKSARIRPVPVKPRKSFAALTAKLTRAPLSLPVNAGIPDAKGKSLRSTVVEPAGQVVVEPGQLVVEPAGQPRLERRRCPGCGSHLRFFPFWLVSGLLLLRLFEAFVHFVPVHRVPPRRQILRPAILIFQVVRVLPHVVAQNGEVAL